MEKPQNGTIKWIKDEIRFAMIIIGIMGSVFANYYIVKSSINKNSYRIDTIETARTESWDWQKETNNKTTENLERLKDLYNELDKKILSTDH